MTARRKTVVVTGASQGIGAEIAHLFMEHNYNVVANSRRISYTSQLRPAQSLALVDGDIGLEATAQRIVATAVDRFGSVDALVNNAGIFSSKPFTDYTPEEIDALMATDIATAVLYLTEARQVTGEVLHTPASSVSPPGNRANSAVPIEGFTYEHTPNPTPRCN